jgi:hypothetical protein
MLRKRSTLILALLVVVIGIARTAHAGPQAGGWMLLGTSHVDGKSDHDKIKWPVGGGRSARSNSGRRQEPGDRSPGCATRHRRSGVLVCEGELGQL